MIWPVMSVFPSAKKVIVSAMSSGKATRPIGMTFTLRAMWSKWSAIQRVMTGPKPETAAGTPDMSRREKWVVAPLIAVFIALGFYPAPVLDVINPAVARTLQFVGATDPAPTHPGSAEGAVK